MKKIISLMAILVLFAACKKDSESSEKKEIFGRTVIVYMSGENNLDQLGVLDQDLLEMRRASKQIPASDRLVVYVDRLSRSETPFIAEIKNAACDTIMHYANDFYSSDPEHFYNVIKTIEEKYPSQEYALVLWGHATSWLVDKDTVASATAKARQQRRAYGQDCGDNTVYGPEKWLNITQMRRELAKLPKFSYIFADCCCMMSVETAYELRNVTDYLIGSPAEIPGDGAPYDKIMDELFSRNTTFYQSIIDKYYDYYMELYRTPEYANSTYDSYLTGYSVPLSVVDMKHIGELAQSTRNLLKEPGEYTFEQVPYYFHMDLPVCYDMACLLEANSTAEEFETWKRAFDLAVPYRRLSDRWMTIYDEIQLSQVNKGFVFNKDNYGGLSMFVPRSIYDSSYWFIYNAALPSFEWSQAVGWNRFGY